MSSRKKKAGNNVTVDRGKRGRCLFHPMHANFRTSWGQHEAWHQEVTIKLPVLSDEHLSVAEFAVMKVRAILVQCMLGR